MRFVPAILTATAVAFTGVSGVLADVLYLQGGGVQSGQVVRADSAGIAIKVGENEFTIPRVSIVRADVAKPDAVEKGLAAQRAGKNQEAVTNFKAVVDGYAGLPLPWAEDCMLRFGEVQVLMKDFNAAKKTFETFKAYYPKSPALQVLEIKSARVLVEQKQPDKAIPMIEAVINPLIKKDFITDQQEAGVAEGLVLLGDCLAAAGKTDDALDSYLKVITLFDVDSDRTLEARYKAGKLLEQIGNWRRAKQTYGEVLKETNSVAYVEDTKKRLDALTKAHPE